MQKKAPTPLKVIGAAIAMFVIAWALVIGGIAKWNNHLLSQAQETKKDGQSSIQR